MRAAICVGGGSGPDVSARKSGKAGNWLACIETAGVTVLISGIFVAAFSGISVGPKLPFTKNAFKWHVIFDISHKVRGRTDKKLTTVNLTVWSTVQVRNSSGARVQPNSILIGSIERSRRGLPKSISQKF